ncbi:MAG TPA: FlgD immunoglobulin-like domain containing protein, partial [Spirochaetia bacterium]|nr:FlgD immunoglobulin-like domain containing protein [Spirochaetia bacterium]
ITFDQTTTKKASWQGIIRNSTGTVVRTVSWRDRPDAQFVWDGHGNDKSLLPDGTYTYTLEGTDAAGNTGRSAPLTFAIDTTATPVVVSTDLTYFSPNGDGIQDTISIMPSLKVATGVVSFDLVVLDARGTPVRTFSGKQQVPAKITWDGRDGFGNRAPDGQYTAQLTVLYENGNKPVAKTNPFFIDTVYPTVQVSASPLLFSPDGDGRLDSVSFTQSSSSEGQWEGTIRDSAGTVVRTYYWKGEAQSFVWDGRDDAGNIVLDGTYSYLVTATDAAGNHTEKRIGDIVVDTRPTPISIGASSDGFSPNGDGFRDTISFSLSVGLKSGIDSWKVDMVDAGGSVQKSFAGGSSVPETIVWDGKRNDGTASPDGSYTAVMSVSYAKGNAPIARSAPFLLAVAPPKISVSIGPLPFSPDGDGVNDTLSIALSAQDPSPIVSWSATIVDPVGHFFRSFSGQGTPPASVVWDGLSADGELVQSAEDYPMTVTMKDALGNVGTVKKSIPIDVLVIREGDKLKVRISSITFAPDTADYLNVPPDRRERNMATLRRLAEIFTKYSQYDIRIEGYAVMVYWDDPVKGKAEQEQVLIPLSKARAEAIKSALVQLGLDAKRITTVGLGGTNPIVPFSDLENRWKDRRVEFVLIRSTARQ